MFNKFLSTPNRTKIFRSKVFSRDIFNGSSRAYHIFVTLSNCGEMSLMRPFGSRIHTGVCKLEKGVEI